jgi:CRP-like cAMP-binding protein
MTENNEDKYISEEDKSLNWENLAEKLQKEQPRTRYLKENSKIKFLLFPDDAFLEYWNVLIILLLIYTATVIPYRISLVETDDISFIIWDTIVDFLYFLDTVFNCFLAYYNQDGELITDKKKIFYNYLRGWLFIDLVSCAPVQIIFQTGSSYSKVGKLPKLSRLIKMTKLIRMVKIIKARSQILKYISKIYKVEAGVERLIWFLMTFLLMIHILACLWIFIGVYFLYDSYNNWIMQSNLQDLGSSDLYITGLYWCVTTLATVGYGDIHPFNTTERLYATGVMMIGIFIYSYIIGSLTNLLANLDSRKAKLTKKLETLDNLTKEYGFNLPFYRKLCVALEYQHLNNKQELADLLEDIPVNLRTQLLILIYQKILESNAFFQNKPSFFAAFVAPLLKPVRYDSEEYIYRENDFAKEMYFIVKGEVSMIATVSNEEICFNTVTNNYYFGETDILFSEAKERAFTTKSLLKCELLSLDHLDFESMLKKFEEESIEIMELAHQRNQRLQDKKEKAIKVHTEDRQLKTIRSFPAAVDPKSYKLFDIISNSANSPVAKRVEELSEIEKPLSTRDEITSIQNFLSYNPQTEDNKILQTHTLYNSVVEEKLVKEEDNLKIARKKIVSIEKNVEECLSVLKNITDFFDIDYEPGLLRFSSVLKYEESLNINKE